MSEKSISKFKGKGGTLAFLQGKLLKSQIPSFVMLDRQAWEELPGSSDPTNQLSDQRSRYLAQTLESLNSERIVVRSCHGDEDSSKSSNAGKYLSILNLMSCDKFALSCAIDRVLASYACPEAEQKVIIQCQVENVSMSGVLFTVDLNTGSPYFVCNFDTSGRTDSITSGSHGNYLTQVRYRNSPFPSKNRLHQVLTEEALHLERILECPHLDIEFAFTTDDQLMLLQVRPIVPRVIGEVKYQSDQFDDFLARTRKKVRKITKPQLGLVGQNGMLSVMTDWNPAEMIGIRPRALALSLYRHLITNDIWAVQRFRYGYRDLRGFPLLVSLLGQPYIDVRTSFNSFVPASLSNELATKLVDYYTAKLSQHPCDHDKVELKIVFSCYSLDLNDRLKSLLKEGFSELELDRIKFSLLNLTNDFFLKYGGNFQADLESVGQLEEKLAELADESIPVIDRIYWLVEHCKRYGTLPFAGLARAGFVAVQLLNSMVSAGVLTQDERDRFMNSLNTVARGLSQDAQALIDCNISKQEFLKRYGHLRPGTYDILSPSYREKFDRYFGFQQSPAKFAHGEGGFKLSSQAKARLDAILVDNGLKIDAEGILLFIKSAIEARESAKFVFTKAVSRVLELIKELGFRNNLTIEDLSFVEIGQVLELYSHLTSHSVHDILMSNILKNKADYQVSKQIRMPSLIQTEEDIYQFSLDSDVPSYITQQSYTGEVVVIDQGEFGSLAGKIVFVKSADPGYDWLFAHNIGGLVTMYGGSNSHMAIRCAELQIPAVIGCGEKSFEAWSKHRYLELDCVNAKVVAI